MLVRALLGADQRIYPIHNTCYACMLSCLRRDPSKKKKKTLPAEIGVQHLQRWIVYSQTVRAPNDHRVFHVYTALSDFEFGD